MLTPSERNDTIRMAIKGYMDAIYLSLYMKRFGFNADNVSHIRSAILTTMTDIRAKIATIPEINQMESTVFSELETLLKNPMSRTPIIYDVDRIVAMLSTSPSTELIEGYVRLVLAMTKQIQYKTVNLIIPAIHIVFDDGKYKIYSMLNRTQYLFDSSSIVASSGSWYNILAGITLPADNSLGNMKSLLNTLFISYMPDTKNGLGITILMFDEVIISDMAANFANAFNTEIIDTDNIKRSLGINNRYVLDIDYANMATSGKMASTESVSYSLEAAGDDTGDDTGDDAGDDAGDDSGGDDAGGDPGDDNVDSGDAGSNADDQNNPSNDDGKNKDADDHKTIYLGLNFELPKDETLDDILYKITVSRYIDDVLRTQSDELPSETVAAMVKWKNLFIFLVSAKETKNFLTKYKIKQL